MNSQPDIIFICSDQWNARYLGCAGHPQVQTPHLDALAAEGCIFDAAYTPSPAPADTAQRLRNRLLTFLTDTQLNHARGYKPLFTRIGMQFPTEDPADRKRIIRDRLRKVHKHQP